MSASHPLRLLGSELHLMLSRKRNIAGLAVLSAVPIIIAFAIHSSGEGPDLLGGLSNASLVPLVALLMESAFFLPLAIAMLAGDAIAGEAASGTLRYLLVAPVRRSTLLAVKYVSLMVGAGIGVGLIALVGVAIGIPLFGAGDTITLSGTSISFGASLGRVLLAALYLTWMICGFAAIGLFFSTLVDHAMAVTVGLMVVVILGWIIEGVTQLSWLHPWLLNHWLASFADLLREPPLWSNMLRGAGLSLGYIVVFWTAAWAKFSTKDISS